MFVDSFFQRTFQCFTSPSLFLVFCSYENMNLKNVKILFLLGVSLISPNYGIMKSICSLLATIMSIFILDISFQFSPIAARARLIASKYFVVEFFLRSGFFSTPIPVRFPFRERNDELVNFLLFFCVRFHPIKKTQRNDGWLGPCSCRS